jgi:hypothetical protein
MVGRGFLKPDTAVRVCPSHPVSRTKPDRLVVRRNFLKVDIGGSNPSPAARFFHAGVVQRIRIPGYEPGDLEVRILPPVPFPARPSNGQGAAIRRLEFRFDPGRGQHLRSVGRLERRPAVYRVQASSILVRSAKVRGDVDKLAKSPVFQAGHRGFESRHRYHWPEAHKDEQAILNRRAASSILARPTKFCRYLNWSSGRLLLERTWVRVPPTAKRGGDSNPSTVTMPGSSAGRGDWSNTPAQLSSILSPGTKMRLLVVGC